MQKRAHGRCSRLPSVRMTDEASADQTREGERNPQESQRGSISMKLFYITESISMG
jgi:hypothetical protein